VVHACPAAMWWSNLYFAQPPEPEGTKRRVRSAPSGEMILLAGAPKAGRKSVVADMLSRPATMEGSARSRDGPVLGSPEDPFVMSRTNKQVHETLGRLRGLSTGFKKDYLNTFPPGDDHLGVLAMNHSAAARRKAKKFDKENPSLRAPTYDKLHAHTQQMMRNLDPDFDATHRQRMLEMTRRRKVEEWAQEEPGVPPEAKKGGRPLKVFVDFLVFVNNNFCTDDDDTWILGGYEECYNTLSFTGAAHLCSNEWNTNLASLKFDAHPHEVFALFRDIADEGIIPKERFIELESMGSFIFDALRQGVAKAKQQQQTRKMGFVPEKPQSDEKKAQALAEYGDFMGKLRGATVKNSDYMKFIAEEQQKAKTHRKTVASTGDIPRKTVAGEEFESSPKATLPIHRQSMPMFM